MTISLQPITPHNWVECKNLDITPAQNQRYAVAPNVWSLAQAYAEPWWVPLAIYNDTTMIGFAMYGRLPSTNINYILRFMIDAHHQGKGYGKAALTSLINLIQQQNSHEIQLDYDPDDPIAVRLYTNAGFRPIGLTEDGVLASLSA